jgi:Type I phosphodiesterase / nucleotide pyrophosphatase
VLDWPPVADTPIIPAYDGACIANIAPTVLGPRDGPRPEWFPRTADARQTVLLVIDGLGWEQLQARNHLAPTLAGLDGGAIHAVAPTTTATGLTSITTGLPPGEHGVIGYRIVVDNEVLNVLRWNTAAGDARRRIVPRDVQSLPPFLATRPPVVTRAEFAHSGFSAAHLGGSRQVGYRVLSTLTVEVRRLLAAGERFVYAYYDGIDKVAHEYGLGEHYDAELAAVDDLVAALTEALPDDAVLLITADHGQVDVGDAMLPLHDDVLKLVRLQSGEARFRWLHARPGAAGDLTAAAEAAHGADAWVVTRERMRDEHWFGPQLPRVVAERLGDVALVASSPVGFDDPADTGPFALVCRHGSMTADEVLVPLLAARRR